MKGEPLPRSVQPYGIASTTANKIVLVAGKRWASQNLAGKKVIEIWSYKKLLKWRSQDIISRCAMISIRPIPNIRNGFTMCDRVLFFVFLETE